MTQLIIVKSFECQRILLNEGMQLQCVFDLYRNLFELPSIRFLYQYNIMLNSTNRDIVHHLLMYECDPTVVFPDDNLPEGLCDDLYDKIHTCTANIATAWAVGGDTVSVCISSFVDEKYCLNRLLNIQKQLDIQLEVILKSNITRFRCIIIIKTKNQVQKIVKYESNVSIVILGRTDSTGIRYYLGNELRPHELGYLTFGADSTFVSLAIPPRADRFIVDAYCTATATSVSSSQFFIQ